MRKRSDKFGTEDKLSYISKSVNSLTSQMEITEEKVKLKKNDCINELESQ